jgi:Fe-Mn family superoxide dismutase
MNGAPHGALPKKRNKTMKHEQPKLPYAYDALEPVIDAKTMEVHYAKHHATYVAKLNDALATSEMTAAKPLIELLANLDDVPANIRTAVKNHGGGTWNHSFFWAVMAPENAGGGGEAGGTIRKAIDARWGEYMKFVAEFTAVATTHFGSGWAWLVVTNDKEHGTTKRLEVLTTPNQDCPLSLGQTPLLTLDLWEHAYYLKYQNRRAEYIENWWRVVNWEQVEANFTM